MASNFWVKKLGTNLEKKGKIWKIWGKIGKKKKIRRKKIIQETWFKLGNYQGCLSWWWYHKEFIPYLLPVLFVLDGIDSAAGPRSQGVVKLGVLAESARVTQERVLLVIVDGPLCIERWKIYQKLIYKYGQTCFSSHLYRMTTCL